MLNNKTVKMRRKNVFLDVVPELVDKYMAKGYDIVDETGNVLKKSVPTDIASLKSAYDQHVKKIAELEETIKNLKAEIVKLQSVSVENTDVEINSEETTAKRVRKSKK